MEIIVQEAKPRLLDLQESADRWAELALQMGWTDQWVEGAIFPCEMVYFLARVETEGIATIIESGRQDGFSTLILGEFARRTGVRVISIDYEEEVERGQLCRARLSGYPVEALVGDAFELFGVLLEDNNNASIAVLIDGPKGWDANALVYASAVRRNVQIIALHNQVMGREYSQDLFKQFTPIAFHENFLTANTGAWARLREIEAALDDLTFRSMAQSSLAIFIVPNDKRAKIGRHMDYRFMFFQPPLLNLAWQAGLHRFARWLHNLSYRVFYSRIWRLFRQ